MPENSKRFTLNSFTVDVVVGSRGRQEGWGVTHKAIRISSRWNTCKKNFTFATLPGKGLSLTDLAGANVTSYKTLHSRECKEWEDGGRHDITRIDLNAKQENGK